MQERKYNVVLSARAKRMLGTHIHFIAKVNKTAAKKQEKEIVQAVRSLAHMPQRFPLLDQMYNPSGKYRKMFIEKWYLAIYQIQDDTVYVDYILDCRKEYSWLLH